MSDSNYKQTGVQKWPPIRSERGARSQEREDTKNWYGLSFFVASQ